MFKVLIALCGLLLPACQLSLSDGSLRREALVSLSRPAPAMPGRSMPRAEDLDAAKQPRTKERFYQSWWFWSSIGVAIIAGAAVAVAVSTGGTDRLAEGPDGRFDPQTFPDS